MSLFYCHHVSRNGFGIFFALGMSLIHSQPLLTFVQNIQACDATMLN